MSEASFRVLTNSFSVREFTSSSLADSDTHLALASPQVTVSAVKALAQCLDRVWSAGALGRGMGLQPRGQRLAPAARDAR